MSPPPLRDGKTGIIGIIGIVGWERERGRRRRGRRRREEVAADAATAGVKMPASGAALGVTKGLPAPDSSAEVEDSCSCCKDI